jgi:hypothetical protein
MSSLRRAQKTDVPVRPATGKKLMSSMDDFRFKSHQLLIELDATTTKMMMLVSSKEVTGINWDAAALRHYNAFQAWNLFLNSPVVANDDWVPLLH